MKPLSPQSLQELQILPQHTGDRCVLALLNQTRTYGGKEALRTLLSTPCTSVTQILEHQQLLQFIGQHLVELTIDIAHAYVLAAENHLASNLAWYAARGWFRQQEQALRFAWFHPHEFARLQGGTAALRFVLQTIDNQTRWLVSAGALPVALQSLSDRFRAFFDQPEVEKALRHSEKPTRILQTDYLLRYTYRERVKAIFSAFYQLDAYCTIARFAQKAHWTYPVFVESEHPVFEVHHLTHPLLAQPTGNDFRTASPQVVTLVTGGNMSGKTTFLKACGIAVYLAHLGLPVPARSLRLSFFDQLFTRIHLSDNLEMGYSHFYQELISIKEVFQALSQQERIFLIADELFRGTNPDDSLHCSRLVIDRFKHQTGSLFLISSHHPQISTTYSPCENVQFVCFQTQVVDGRLLHPHKIAFGIAQEQTGLLLFEQLGVLSYLT